MATSVIAATVPALCSAVAGTRSSAGTRTRPPPPPPSRSPGKGKKKKGSGAGSSYSKVLDTSECEKKVTKTLRNELSWCEKILDELVGHEDAWPFLEPVNTRQFPTYKKIIKTPMDLQTIKTRLVANHYKSREAFLQDVRLIFDNCETFNEDDSPVGKAGHSLRVFFESKPGVVSVGGNSSSGGGK